MLVPALPARRRRGHLIAPQHLMTADLPPPARQHWSHLRVPRCLSAAACPASPGQDRGKARDVNPTSNTKGAASRKWGTPAIPQRLNAEGNPGSRAQAEQEAALRSRVVPQIPRASSEDLMAADALQPQVLAGACTPLPGRGHPTIPRGLQTKDVQARDKASPPYKVRHQIPRASPEDAVAAELVRPKVLEAAPRALPDRWRRGPPGIPSCKNAEDVPVFCSKGRPKTEAVPHGIVGLPIPKDSREEATAAVPGSGGHLRHDATPGTSPEDAARAAMYQSHVPAPVPSSQANRVVTELSLDLCP